MSETVLTRRDSLDFRDRIYRPQLDPLAERLLPEEQCIVLRDQGAEGTCGGFGLAAVIDYLNRRRGVERPVSTRMLYEMAKRHDQWPGEDYAGTSARGAMKGWHKNGVCPESAWRYRVDRPGYLTAARSRAALRTPLGAYYRVLPARPDLHCALAETGAVYATAATHVGWHRRRLRAGRIPFEPGWVERGGHAFAILGYTDEGFVIQNSWGEGWGALRLEGVIYPGCAIWGYEDCEKNLWDAWVAQLALPIARASPVRSARYVDAGGSARPQAPAPPQREIRDHYLHIDDGRYHGWGDYPSQPEQVEDIIAGTVGGTRDRSGTHLLLYAHGGLNSVKTAASRAARWRPVFAANAVHELHFFWETGLWEELGDVLRAKQEAASGRAGGPTQWWDRMIERLTQPLGHALWHEMQRDAEIAFSDERAGSHCLRLLSRALAGTPPGQRPQLHLVGHSAGAIWLAHLLRRWTRLEGPPITNLVLLAPACTVSLYNQCIYPALRARLVERLHHFYLDDAAERRDNVAQVYRKSLLYLVSRSYQQRGAVVPLMGMETHLDKLHDTGIKRRVSHFNTRDHRDKTRASSHLDFDDDTTTLNAMLRIIVGPDPKAVFENAHVAGH